MYHEQPRVFGPFRSDTVGRLLLAVSMIHGSLAAQRSAIVDPAGRSHAVTSIDGLKKFLQAHVRKLNRDIDNTTSFSYAFVDLNGDGKDEAIVHMTGRSWCGTGGCNTYILTPYGGTYRFVARIPATRTPIRVLDKTSYGWHSVSTVVRDDATRTYEGELRFNGQKYPLEERPLIRRVPGRVVIRGDEKEIPLFP